MPDGEERVQPRRLGAARRRARARRPLLAPLPARALGRPAPARRDRGRARARARGARVRRAGLGARRLGAHAGAAPARRPARRTRALSLLLITHDVGLAWSLCDRVAVMYLGRIVEIGTTEQVLGDPQHPYTKALLAVAPRVEQRTGAARAAAGRAARRDRDPERLPLPSALPRGVRALPGRRPAAARQRSAPPPAGWCPATSCSSRAGRSAARACSRALRLAFLPPLVCSGRS